MAESRIGKITATSPTAANNKTTATPFYVPSESKISIQCDVACYVEVSDAANASTVATANSVQVQAGALFPTNTPAGPAGACISVLPVSGTGNAQVYVRSGNE